MSIQDLNFKYALFIHTNVSYNSTSIYKLSSYLNLVTARFHWRIFSGKDDLEVFRLDPCPSWSLVAMTGWKDGTGGGLRRSLRCRPTARLVLTGGPEVQWALKLGPHTECQVLLLMNINAVVREHSSWIPETIPRLPIFVPFHYGGSFALSGLTAGCWFTSRSNTTLGLAH